jgi:hypothetical protein
MIYKIKIVPITKKQIKSGFVPKYTVQIKEIDAVGNYIKFAKQDGNTMSRLNSMLDKQAFDMSSHKKDKKDKKVLPGQTTIENAIEETSKHKHDWKWIENPKTNEDALKLKCSECGEIVHQNELSLKKH